MVRLISQIGLDAKKFHTVQRTVADDFYTFASQISDEERFKNVEKWKPRCASCGNRDEFTSLVRENVKRLFIKS
jgi:DNA polymerase alpha subunit A